MTPRRTALVVEDNAADAAYVRALLDGSEFDVRIVTRLADAEAALREGGCHIVVLDMSLPDAHGIEALAALQRADEHVPVVILSGDGDEERARLAVRGGAQDYLMKGAVTEGALRRSMRYAIERQQMRARIALGVDELEKQRASVLELNQLKNDLIATLVHDIKGPLTSITGFAELLEEGYLEGAEASDAARTIRTNAQRLANLANDVLALSRVEHGELEIADDKVSVRDVIDDVAKGQPEGAVEVEGPPEAFVRGDDARLRQVFDNLVRNGIKYGRQGEPVRVRIDASEETIAVAISDRGIGIPPADLPKLFERFARASNARRAKISGTGLGLFIARMIVERHGGSIAVESEVDRGSTFTVSLPAYASARAYFPRRVGIITADPSLSRFVAYELRSHGYRVREYGGAADFGRLDEGRSNDVLLLDARCCSPGDVRPFIPAAARVRLVGIGTGSGGDGYDAVLPRPFLLSDLFAIVEE